MLTLKVWDVPEAIENMKQLAKYEPWFIEEPTSPDDILGHARIRRELKPYNIGVATGEQCQNRVMWKQLFQAEAIDYAQIDACRLGGVNEVLAVLLMAKKFDALWGCVNSFLDLVSRLFLIPEGLVFLNTHNT